MTVPCNCFAPGSDLCEWLRSKSRSRSAKDSAGSSSMGWGTRPEVEPGSAAMGSATRTGSATGSTAGSAIGSGATSGASSRVGNGSTMFSSVMTGYGPFSHDWAGGSRIWVFRLE